MTRWTLPLVAVLGAALGAIGLLWFQANAPGRVDIGGDRGRVERIVHDYVLAHPDIIPEAMDRLRDNQHASTIAANRDAILQPFAGAWAGNPQGDVTMVEYFDYNCGYCRASLPAIRQLLARDPKVRIVYRDFPILAQSSVEAARMSLAAADQNRFQPFHDALYAAGPVSSETIAASAKAAGLDLARAGAFASRADAEISANETVARALGLTGTPSWVIGNKVVSAALPLEELQKAVAEARAGK